MVNTLQQMMTPDEVADLLQVPLATLYGWRYKGTGPPSVRIGRHLRYDQAEVGRWILALKA